MAGKALILDASSAILLAKIDVLRTIVSSGEVWMAESAFREATVKESLPDAQLIGRLASEGLLKAGKGNSAETARLKKDFRLDEGEAETIALAGEKGAIAATDDGPAIRCLKVLGRPFASAIALLVVLVEVGKVTGDLAIELLAKLEKFGRYDPRILEDAARRIRAATSGRGDVP